MLNHSSEMQWEVHRDPHPVATALLPPATLPPTPGDAWGRGGPGEIGCWELQPLFVAKIKPRHK